MSLVLGSRPLCAARRLRLGNGASCVREAAEWHRSKLADGRRHIRTGFFPEDADYIDPERPLLAEKLGSRWRYMDDPSLNAPVLERNNVGMGMLVLNRPQGLDLPAINSAYTRLLNLEVNTFKRFVGLTAREPDAFCNGIHPRELLLAAAATSRGGHLPLFSRALLWHNQELTHLVADYRKPLVCYLSGSARNSGAALVCLANFSGVSEASEITVDACSMGLVPDGGMTFVLGRLQWHLGEYLALTGRTVQGADLIYCELAQHWLSPEALPFLEVTSEKQLEVSETDARALLEEHSLPVPDVPREEFLSRFNLPLIDKVFGAESMPAIEKNLKDMLKSSDAVEKAFADDCLKQMSRACPLALHATLRLIQDVRESQALQRVQRSGGARTWEAPGQMESSRLIRALRLELRAQQRLLERQDAVVGLHARCLGQDVKPGGWSIKSLLHVVSHDVDDLLREPTEDDASDLVDFSVSPRSEMTLSQHPKMRKFHPDYNPKTKTDHDPEWMAAEVQRWSPTFCEEQRKTTIEDLLDGEDPALFGLSRWVRPGARSQAA